MTEGDEKGGIHARDISGIAVGGDVHGDVSQVKADTSTSSKAEERGPWRLIGRIALIAGIVCAVAAVICVILTI